MAPTTRANHGDPPPPPQWYIDGLRSLPGRSLVLKPFFLCVRNDGLGKFFFLFATLYLAELPKEKKYLGRLGDGERFMSYRLALVKFLGFQGTDLKQKNSILIEEFGINYSKIPAIFRKGSILICEHRFPWTWTRTLSSQHYQKHYEDPWLRTQLLSQLQRIASSSSPDTQSLSAQCDRLRVGN